MSGVLQAAEDVDVDVVELVFPPDPPPPLEPPPPSPPPLGSAELTEPWQAVRTMEAAKRKAIRDNCIVARHVSKPFATQDQRRSPRFL